MSGHVGDEHPGSPAHDFDLTLHVSDVVRSTSTTIRHRRVKWWHSLVAAITVLLVAGVIVATMVGR